MLAGLIGRVAAVPVLIARLGFVNVVLFSVTFKLNGILGPALYMSLPWMRSYMMPKPPRTTVLPLPLRS